MVTAVALVLILLGTIGGNKHLLFNRYIELFISYLAEVIPTFRKILKCTSKALKHSESRLDKSYVKISM